MQIMCRAVLTVVALLVVLPKNKSGGQEDRERSAICCIHELCRTGGVYKSWLTISSLTQFTVGRFGCNPSFLSRKGFSVSIGQRHQFPVSCDDPQREAWLLPSYSGLLTCRLLYNDGLECALNLQANLWSWCVLRTFSNSANMIADHRYLWCNLSRPD